MPTNRTTCRVIYGDTDNMGQAYYGNYFRWFEIGRTELFRSLGISYASVESRGIFLPVAEAYYERAMSLPLFPDLTHAQQDRVVAELRRAIQS